MFNKQVFLERRETQFAGAQNQSLAVGRLRRMLALCKFNRAKAATDYPDYR